MANATAMVDLLKAGLTKLMDRFPFIGDVRGKGLLLAFELVSDRRTMLPLPKQLAAFDRLVEIAYDKGLIIYSRRTRGGYEGDHFLVCPPMTITEEQIGEVLTTLTEALGDFAKEVDLPVSAAA